MNFVFCFISLYGFLAKETCGGVFSFIDPFNISSVVQKGVDKVGQGIEAVGDGASKIASNVHKGLFRVEKGVVNGLSEVIGTPIDLKEVQFYLATAKNYHNPSRIDFHKPKDVAQTDGAIYFIIHGWKSSRNVTEVRDMTEILVKKQPNAHVVQVNWDGPASDNYAFSAYNTESVGELIGLLVNRLVSEYKVSQERIVLIGHSLGGQICGWVGKKIKAITGKKLPRIIALDPAGPLFTLRPDSKRLNKNDAEEVRVVHTDGDKFGFGIPCGTIDFFPNGGDNQPGCWSVTLKNLTDPVSCDHGRAWDYFNEALNCTGSFAAEQCESYDDFENDSCEGEIVAMGDLKTKETGNFYLDTNAEKPFSITGTTPDDRTCNQHTENNA